MGTREARDSISNKMSKLESSKIEIRTKISNLKKLRKELLSKKTTDELSKNRKK